MDRFLNISNRIRALQAEMGLSPPASAGRERSVRGGDEEVKATEIDEANFAAVRCNLWCFLFRNCRRTIPDACTFCR
jgi:hypothetical protein